MTTKQPSNLQNQKALVTGATSGIGRAIAPQLARDGAEVVVHGRDATRGAETVSEIVTAGGPCRPGPRGQPDSKWEFSEAYEKNRAQVSS